MGAHEIIGANYSIDSANFDYEYWYILDICLSYNDIRNGNNEPLPSSWEGARSAKLMVCVMRHRDMLFEKSIR